MKGRYINQSDISQTKVAVIARPEGLFKSEEAIGKYINLGSSAFKVVGIFQDEVEIMKKEIFIYPLQLDS